MPRELKPYPVEVVQHPNGRQSIELLFDRDRKEFFATFGMERVAATDLNEARRLACELLVRAPKYAWTPVIIVDGVTELDDTERWWARDRTREHVELSFEFYRCEVADDPVPATRDQKRRGWKPGKFERAHTIDFEEIQRRMINNRSWQNLEYRKSLVAKAREERDQNRQLEQFHLGDGDVMLPYSEELWTGVCAIRDGVVETRRRLSQLIARPDFATRLLSITSAPVAPMLPEYTPKKKARRS